MARGGDSHSGGRYPARLDSGSTPGGRSGYSPKRGLHKHTLRADCSPNWVTVTAATLGPELTQCARQLRDPGLARVQLWRAENVQLTAPSLLRTQEREPAQDNDAITAGQSAE